MQLACRFRAVSRRQQATSSEGNATRCVGSMECPESRNCAVDPSRIEGVYSNSEPLDRVPPRLRRMPKCPDKQTSEASLPHGERVPRTALSRPAKIRVRTLYNAITRTAGSRVPGVGRICNGWHIADGH